MEEAIQNEYKVRKQFEDHPELLADFHRYYQLNDENYSDESMIEDESAVINEMEEIDQKFRDAGLGDLWDQYYIARSELKSARYKAEHGAVPSSTAYFNTAGEVEARNVQRRRNYTMEERLNSLLSETEDVAEKDKIYLNGLVRGGSEMAAENIFIDKITDDYFINPDKDVYMHSLPNVILTELNKPNKPLVLKKNIVEKNKVHSDLSENDIIQILGDAIYNCDLLIQPSPQEKPNYFMLVSKGTKNKQALLEISEDKEHYEIVNYHYIGNRQLQQKINRAKKGNGIVRNISRDGLPSPIITQKGAAGRFSALPAEDNLSLTAKNTSGKFGNSSRNSVSPEADAEYLAAVERGDI